MEMIRSTLSQGGTALFLDYDGTLTPIVSTPDQAHLGDSMKGALEALAGRYTVAVVSGRDLHDVKRLVGLEGIFYVGSHGLDIEGPGGLRWQHEEARARRRGLEDARTLVERRLAGLAGVLFETKRFSLAVHYRNVEPGMEAQVLEAVEAAAADQAGLRIRSGKKVAELQPDVAWNKGSAVEWLLEALGLDGSSVHPVYAGDDLTDEDAFGAIGQRGFGIIVGDHGQPTRAGFRLKDTDEVERFLRAIME